MKNVLKLSLVLLVIGLLSTSCKKDLCYECTGYSEDGVTVEDIPSICEGDDDGNGGTFTEESLKDFVAIYEAFGGDCKKK